MANVIKKCSCGKTYTREQWAKLKLVGHGQGLEYRNCTCGSTIAIEIEEQKGEERT